MPILKTEQPEYLIVDDEIRLRKYDGRHDFAYEWYQDVETVYLVDGIKQPYSEDKVRNMYEYLNNQGELYFIEVKKETAYLPIGDVTFWQDDMPIVIGNREYRGKKIGERVIARLIERGIELGYKTLRVSEIYDFNAGSRRCFDKNGFKICEKTEKGSRYLLEL